MTTISDIIEFLNEKAESERKCQPSMDGRREEYYKGKFDAYIDCANMLKRYIEQENNGRER